MLIIDEISMVSRDLFYKIHARILEIFMSPTPISFAGLSIVVLEENQYMLLLIEGFLSLGLWNIFKFVELTEVMRQRGDIEFIEFLNKIRV